MEAGPPEPSIAARGLGTVRQPGVLPGDIAPRGLVDLNARVLDPATAILAPGLQLRRSTAYIADTLIIRPRPTPNDPQDGFLPALTPEAIAALNRVDPQVEVTAASPSAEPGLPDFVRLPLPDAVCLRLSARGKEASSPPDAWAFLQKLIAAGGAPGVVVTLEHVLTACPPGRSQLGGVWGGVGGVWGGVGGVWGGVGGVWGGVAGEYGSPGFGGRSPVVWGAPDPYDTTLDDKQRPVVAVLDTGIGDHPWFVDHSSGAARFHHGVEQWTVAGEHLVRQDGPATEPIQGAFPRGGLIDVEEGHGTFVAGIIRQRCPSARIVSIPVMRTDGAAAEFDVYAALRLLLARHLAANGGQDAIDVVSLSLGYYHESSDDALDDGPIEEVLRSFAEHGVAVVAAAGNDGTTVPFWPAAMAPTVGSADPTQVPMTSVGALNPDGATAAFFSNGGDWVLAYEPGAGIVSTVPVTLSGSRGRTIDLQPHVPIARATVDPDAYASGFAIWSGTSFAAPCFAGDLADQIAVSRAAQSQHDGKGSEIPEKSRPELVHDLRSACSDRIKAAREGLQR